MSQLTYVLTFGIYALSHGTLQAYFFNKPDLMKTFGIGEFFLGFIDMLMNLSMALGCVLRYSLLKGHDLTMILLKTGIIINIASVLIPYFSYLCTAFPAFLDINIVYIVLGSSFFLIGLFQFAPWPISLTLVNQHLSYKINPCLFGFWGISWQMGSIFSLLTCNFIVHQMEFKWESSIFFMGCIYMVLFLLTYFFVQNKEQEKNASYTGEITVIDFLRFTKESFQNPSISIYFLISGLCTAAYYSIQMWLPSFFYSVGFGEVSGYLSLTFNVSAIFGSLIYSILVKHQNRLQSQNLVGNSCSTLIGNFFQSFFSELSMIVCIVICLLFVVAPHSYSSYIPLTIGLGFFLGGSYNTLHTKDITTIFQNDFLKTEMIGYLTFATNKLSIAFFQLFIGWILSGDSNDQKQIRPQNFIGKTYQKVFYIVILAIVLTLVGFGIRSYLKRRV